MSTTDPENRHCQSIAQVPHPRPSLRNLSRIIAAFFIATQIAMMTAQPAYARAAERPFQNPPVLKYRQGAITSPTLQAAPNADGHIKEFDLDIQYQRARLRNPQTNTEDKVRLRSYVSTDPEKDTDRAPYVAPLIEVEPGDTIRVNLNNQLPPDPTCNHNPKDLNDPHCFNSTNLHTHGLWVSPTGNSDNVLISIDPGVKFQYEYNLPSDHPAGTFWYHPHRHGSTALQVASGMAGALIVRGDRLPSETVNGDIDTLLKRPDGTEMPERTLVLQQLQYYCSDSKHPWECQSGDTGVIESYRNFAPGSWEESGRHTSINGKVLPIFSAKAGEIERWRLIHAGVRDTISLRFKKMKEGAAPTKELSKMEENRYIKENCTGDSIPFHVIADDGLTRNQAWKTRLMTLQPGYHDDALVVFPGEGEYCVIDTKAPAPGSVGPKASQPQLLGTVTVGGGQDVVPNRIHDYLIEQLVLAAQRNMPRSVQPEIIADLKDHLKLTKFTPHPTIDEKEVNGKQELAFDMIQVQDKYKDKFLFTVSNSLDSEYEPHPYGPDLPTRKLTLGNVEEWKLESRSAGHPYHIHVNPFQVIEILDPDGNDVSSFKANDGGKPKCDTGAAVRYIDWGDPECADGSEPQYPKGSDRQYRGLKGVWKDTLWIKGPTPDVQLDPVLKREVSNYPKGVYRVIVRTRYQRYIGEFVLHCHILDHEDQGMMQKVEIALPDEPNRG